MDYAVLVRSGVPFAQANYGDGEWACILGHQGGNVNGEAYTVETRDALTRTLLEPVGMWCGTNPGKKLALQVDAWLKKHRPEVTWLDKEILPSANVNGKLAPFLEAVRERTVVLVGPLHLTALPPEVFVPVAHVVVPDGRACAVASGTAEKVERLAEDGSLVLFASGMASNIVIHALWPEMEIRGVTLLDIGALLDPYVGVYSRKGYRKPTWPASRALNLA